LLNQTLFKFHKYNNIIIVLIKSLFCKIFFLKFYVIDFEASLIIKACACGVVLKNFTLSSNIIVKDDTIKINDTIN